MTEADRAAIAALIIDGPPLDEPAPAPEVLAGGDPDDYPF